MKPLTIESAKWEFGYHVHGYWVGTSQVGRVAHLDRAMGGILSGYGASYKDPRDGSHVEKDFGRGELSKAKAWVEENVRRVYSDFCIKDAWVGWVKNLTRETGL